MFKVLIAFLTVASLANANCKNMHSPLPTLGFSMKVIQRELSETDFILRDLPELNDKTLAAAIDHLQVVILVTKEVINGYDGQFAPKKLQTLDAADRPKMLKNYLKMWNGFLLLIEKYQAELVRQQSFTADQRNFKNAHDISMQIQELSNVAHYRF